MLFENISILDENFAHKENQWVGVKDGRIAYVGSAAPKDAASYGETYDGHDKLLMPALYNAHAHAPMTLLRGYAENVPLNVWLNDLVWPFEAKLTSEDGYWATLLACAEMARYGVVGFSDMYYFSDERACAVKEAHMKVNLCESELFFEQKPFSEYAVAAKMERVARQYHGACDGRIRVEYNIHGEYTSNELTCRGVIEAAKAANLPLSVHISETKSEHEECKQRHNGMTPVQYFDSLGAFDVPVIAAHCTWAEDEDIRILKDRGAFAALCPASNMKLGSGFAPAAKLLDAGVNVCLGTDGMGSNNNHDMFQDMYLMGLAYKGANLDPAIVSPEQVLKAATRTGALAQGRPDCGCIAQNMRADLIVLDTTSPSWHPLTNAAVHAVYAGHGSDVVLTMCDGCVVYQDGNYPTIDVEQAKAEVNARTQRIISEL